MLERTTLHVFRSLWKELGTYIVQPVQASGICTWVIQIIFEQEVKDYLKERRQNKTYMAEMYNIIHRQCTKEFIDQMQMYPEYVKTNE